MPKLNAIRVGETIEKVHVDFSSFESLKESTNFERLYTIHTKETIAISEKLGFHVAGFCDDRGEGGPKLAAEIAGYPSLPSDLILCLMDDKYNFLPLDEGQLETLYLYLTTGEIKSSASFKKDEYGEFLRKYDISPILPDFPVEPSSFFFEEYPNIAFLIYDFSNANDKQMNKIGEQLFIFADRLLKEFEVTGGKSRLSPDGKYYLNNQVNMAKQRYYILVEAILDSNVAPQCEDLEAFINRIEDNPSEEDEVIETKTEVEEDAPEEVMEEHDEDYDGNYIIEMQIDAFWPDSPDKFSYSAKHVLLKVFTDDQDYIDDVQYFKGVVTKFKYLDRISDKVTLDLDFKDHKEEVTLELNKPKVVKFDYVTSVKTTRRVGTLTLTLRRLNLAADQLDGKLEFHFTYTKGNKVVVDETKYIEHVNSDNGNNEMIDMKDLMTYGVFQVDLYNKYIVLYGFETEKPEEGKEWSTYYYGFDYREGMIKIEKVDERLKKPTVLKLEVKYIDK